MFYFIQNTYNGLLLPICERLSRQFVTKLQNTNGMQQPHNKEQRKWIKCTDNHLWNVRKKITADGDCSHEIKRRLLLGRKVMTNLDSIFKSRDITLPTKVHVVKAMVFPVVMYGCEGWTWRKLSAEELMLLNCGVEEDSWESLGLQGDPTSTF